MALAASFKVAGRNDWSTFFGPWAPPFLTLGIYNKLVKQKRSNADTKHKAKTASKPSFQDTQFTEGKGAA